MGRVTQIQRASTDFSVKKYEEGQMMEFSMITEGHCVILRHRVFTPKIPQFRITLPHKDGHTLRSNVEMEAFSPI